MMLVSKIVDVAFSLSLFANAVLFIPQAARIYRKKEARGLSLITFFGFLIFQLLAVIHGLYRNDYVLSIGMLLSMLTCGSVIVLILRFRFKQGSRE